MIPFKILKKRWEQNQEIGPCWKYLKLLNFLFVYNLQITPEQYLRIAWLLDDLIWKI